MIVNVLTRHLKPQTATVSAMSQVEEMLPLCSSRWEMVERDTPCLQRSGLLTCCHGQLPDIDGDPMLEQETRRQRDWLFEIP